MNIIGDRVMDQNRRYGKPNMAALPTELGRAIIRQMLSTPAPDRAVRRQKAEQLEREMFEARKNEKQK